MTKKSFSGFGTGEPDFPAPARSDPEASIQGRPPSDTLPRRVPGQSYQLIHMSWIHPDPDQPRKTFDDESIKELADSIMAQGLLEPITLRPIAPASGDHANTITGFYIVSGERRFRALSHIYSAFPQNFWARAYDHRVPAIIYEGFGEPKQDSAEHREFRKDVLFKQIVENFQREDIPALELLDTINYLVDSSDMKMTIEHISQKTGISKSWISQLRKINTLPAEILQMAKDDPSKFSARVLVDLAAAKRLPKDPSRIEDLAKASSKVRGLKPKERYQEKVRKLKTASGQLINWLNRYSASASQKDIETLSALRDRINELLKSHRVKK